MSVEASMELQVVSWNVDGCHNICDEQLRLLDDTGADLALLQEVTPTSLRRLRRAGWHGDSALELVDDSHTERGGRRPRFACAVLARRDVAVVSSSLIAGTAVDRSCPAGQATGEGPRGDGDQRRASVVSKTSCSR
jgi:hypothetical protein